MQSVKTSFMDKLTASAPKVSSKSTSKSSSKSFEDMITGNLKASKEETSNKTADTKTVNIKSPAETTAQSKVTDDDTQTKVQNTASNNEVVKSNDNDKSIANQAVSQTDTKSVTEDNVTADLQIISAADMGLFNINDIMNAIKSSISQKLGISEEDIDKALNALGFSPINLLDVNNLKQFLLQVSGNQDMSTFLTNENLGNNLKELMSAMDTIKDQFAISNEQLPALIQQAAVNTADTAKASTQNTVTEDLTKADEEIDITVIKTVKESDGEHTSKDTKAGNNKTEQSLSASELLIQNLAGKSGTGEVAFTDQLAKTQQIREITSQIVEAIKINIKPEQTSMELQLNPDNLGKINLTVVSKDGILTAKFITGTESAKEAIESNLQIFKENLNNQGLKVENVEVTVSYSAFEQDKQKFSNESGTEEQRGQKNRAFKGLDELNEDPLDTTKEGLTNLDSLGIGTSSVNYTA